jgi:hypothetical protein
MIIVAVMNIMNMSRLMLNHVMHVLYMLHNLMHVLYMLDALMRVVVEIVNMSDFSVGFVPAPDLRWSQELCREHSFV